MLRMDYFMDIAVITKEIRMLAAFFYVCNWIPALINNNTFS